MRPEPAEATPPPDIPARHPLDALLRPRSIVVVGASSDPSKGGYRALRALRDSGYAGAVHPVNARGGEILGLRVLRSLRDLPGPVDLALVCTPAAAAPGVLAECGAAGVRVAAVLASGFREAGEEGAALERALLEAARGAGVRVLGPNTSGLLSAHHDLDLVGARGMRRGDVAFLVQSTNLGLSLVTESAERSERGVSLCVGLGNAMDLGLPEMLAFAAADPATRAIAVHAEGAAGARAVLAAAARAVRSTPVVWLQGGRSPAGEAAGRSHTGAAGGAYPVLRAGLAQAGVTELQRADELLPVAETLAGQPPAPAGTGIAVVADDGGLATLALDALAGADAPLAPLSGGTRERLHALLGPGAPVANPVDVSERVRGDPDVFRRAVEAALDDPWVGAVLVVGIFGGYHIRFARGLQAAELAAAEGLARRAGEVGKGLVLHSAYAHARSAPLRALARAGVPVIGSLDVACRCACALVERGRTLALPGWLPEVAGSGPAEPPETLQPALAEGRDELEEREARSLLTRAGLAFGHGGGAVGEVSPDSVALRVTARRDPRFGPVLVVEALAETVHRVLPLDADDVPGLLAELRVASLLHGGGAGPDVAADDLAEAILTVGRCLLENPRVERIEADPLVATSDGVRALAARGRLGPGAPDAPDSWTSS